VVESDDLNITEKEKPDSTHSVILQEDLNATEQRAEENQEEEEDDDNDVPQRRKRKTITLISVLQRADELYDLYPPSHPKVSLDSIMGPHSVMRTWSESRDDSMHSDDAAEDMVENTALIVYPPPVVEPEEPQRKVVKKRKRRTLHLVGRQSTMLASAVLLLGVVIAIYGARSSDGRHSTSSSLSKLGGWLFQVLLT
jgi:TBC1 domain family member 20